MTPGKVIPGGRTANAQYLREVAYQTNPAQQIEWWVKRVTFRDLFAAATSASVTWTDFPTDVWIIGDPVGTHAYLSQVFAGGSISAYVFTFGDAGVSNGLITSTNIFTGASLGIKRTTGAGEFATHHEPAFVPQLTGTSTTANTNAATSGVLDIRIPYIRALGVASI